MNLQEFDTLELAQEYEVPQAFRRIEGPELKTAMEKINIFNGTRARLATYTPAPELSDDLAEAATRLAAMIVKSFDNLFNPEFFLPMDDTQIQQSYAQSLSLGVLTQVEYDAILVVSTEPAYKPHEFATLHDFQLAKGSIARARATYEQGYCIINTTEVCPDHRPQVYRRITFADNSVIYERVAGFPSVSLADNYKVQCPNSPDLYVDNAYGVVGVPT